MLLGIMKYALFYLPLIFLVLSYGYKRKSRRLFSSGRVPDIVTANNLSALYAFLAVVIFVMLFAILNLEM
ncbi:hypothetical protein SAMN05216464_109199 [Mucilaginibacter pineti]|uniref:Uncharacterized protein n=1 Tax=Mucilaginibacter pineti TaxID=1391627 RepID=A0A1G7FT28_9SPHI|nr:hypothetical protein SAMN05216464_109199 [Mucilaginibacter pineti]